MRDLKFLTLKGFAAAEPQYGLGPGNSLHLDSVTSFYKIDVSRFEIVAIHCHYQSGVPKTSSGVASYITVNLICKDLASSTSDDINYVSIGLQNEEEYENKPEYDSKECESPILRHIFDKISIVLAEALDYKDFDFAEMSPRSITLEEAQINTEES